jgi:ABC-type lipoprotein export system ATPase subunit
LDEPTSAMDGKTKMYIYKLIEKLKKDKTIVVVSHDTKIRNYADEVIRL